MITSPKPTPESSLPACVMQARGVGFTYPGSIEPVLREVGFQLFNGERVALVGPSGCGKTTLLRILEGSLAAERGEVDRGGRVVLIYQDHRLVAEATALENVMAGALRERRGFRGAKLIRERALDLLKDVGLGEFAQRRVSQLSGGQKQRVAIARALCSRPDVLLADEPFSNLDPVTARRVGQLLIRLQDKYDFALVCSVHNAGLEDLFTRQIELCDMECPLRCALECPMPRPAQPKSRWAVYAFAAGLATLLAYSAAQIFGNAPSLADSFREMGRIVNAMLPGSLAAFGALPWAKLGGLLWATIQMALVGTAIGAAVSFPLALAASAPGERTWVGRTALGVANVVRSVPVLLWALLFVAALGIGPAAGVMALAAYSTGYLTRLFMEEVENTDPRPAQALMQMGANRWQALRHGLVKPSAPGLLGAVFFVFEYNVRGATVLGVVGAGGIGSELVYLLEWRRFDQFAAGLLLIVAVAISLDAISRAWRKRLAAHRGI